MSSYTKQMIAAAVEWLAVNPDPANPFLNIPGLGKNRSRVVDDTTDADIAKYERMATTRPDMKPHVEELRELTRQVQEIERDNRTREEILEQLFNKLFTPGHSKHSIDDRYNAYIGRWCLAWARHGYNVFDLSQDFVAAMLLTDARELDVSSVRLPFGGLLMITPTGFARGVEGGDYTKIHLTEVPRAELTQLDVAARISDILEAAKKEGQTPEQIREFLAGVEKRVAATGPSILAGKPDPDDTAIHIYATDGVHVLDTLIERKGLTWNSFDDLPDSVCCDADKQARQTLRQIVFGTLAYISAVEHAVEPMVVERPKNARKASDEVSVKRWTVGRTIRIEPQLIRAARAGSREVALRLKHRHIVRGHYRNQAHGIRHRERKQIWIQPFWKGPADGAALVHTYVLEQDKEQP